MYYNVFGEKVSKTRHKEMQNAAKNRRELIAGGCYTRRELMKLGLITSAGMLVAKSGLSARSLSRSVLPTMQAASPIITPFIDPLRILSVKQPVASLTPTPTVCPNLAINPANGLPFEGRTICHQAFNQFLPQKLYSISQAATQLKVSSSLPVQTMWTYDGVSPGPLYVEHYGVPALVRNFCNLPPLAQNGGFGYPSVTTHLHNGHTPSESDGFFFDYYPRDAQGNQALGVPGQFYDQHYPNVLAGFASTNPPYGDINEALSTLWYHDHRVGFTAQNTYKGLVGMYLLFNEFDTGDEHTGFHLPSFPEFDIPMVFRDGLFDEAGNLSFDVFNIDGILGDTFWVNGTLQPFFNVQPRRYRFRWLNVGPSRFLSLYLTNTKNLGANNIFHQIANDGNLLPNPIPVNEVTLGVAERCDVIIDFTGKAGQSFYIENRLQQTTGLGPDDPPIILPAGQGNLFMKINVVPSATAVVTDNSVNPATPGVKFYSLPSTTPEPVVTRNFEWDRLNGMFSINGEFVDPTVTRFTVTQNTVEHWVMRNLSGNWQHPLHIHLEEHQILSRNGAPPPNFEVSRKDVMRIHQNETVKLFFRFRDWTGRYPVHCHNVVHEDHAMILRWEIQPEGDTNRNP
jgi:FtsP/CotA-like multicopper oxidase with cupredoxin domain